MPQVLLIVVFSAQMGAPAASAPVVREEIVVTAERGEKETRRVPAAVSILRRADIDSMAVDDLGSVVDRLPGITTLLEAPGSRPMITARGFFGGGEVEYVQLLIDGIPAADAESGLAPWQSIPAEMIERVEFVRGPASAVYGDSALAGVIEVFTRPAHETSRTHVSLEIGSHDSREATLAWRHMGSIDVNLSAAASSTAGFREHSATERFSTHLSAGFDALDGRLDVRLFGSSVDADEPGMLPLERVGAAPEASLDLFRFDHDATDRLSASLQYTKGGPIPLEAALWTSGRDSTLLRTILLAHGFGDRLERETSTRSFGSHAIADFAAKVAGHANELKVGVEAGRDSLDTRYFAVDDQGRRTLPAAEAEGSRTRVGWFVTDQLDLGRTTLTAGLRYDSIDDSFSTTTRHRAWSPRIGINFGSGPHVFFFQAARAFKAPSLDQLFDQRPYPDFNGGTFTVSNPELRPQRAVNLEGGIRRSATSFRWDFVVYRMRVEDEIDFDVATFRYRNIGESLHRGIEASGEWRFRRAEPRLSYAWTRVEALRGEQRGRQLKNIPEHTLQLGARFELPARLQLDSSIRLLSGWFLDDGNTIPMDDAWRLDFRLRRQFASWTARLDVLNALDSVVPHVGVLLPDFGGGEIPYAYPSGRRSIRAGIELRF